MIYDGFTFFHLIHHEIFPALHAAKGFVTPTINTQDTKHQTAINRTAGLFKNGKTPIAVIRLLNWIFGSLTDRCRCLSLL